MEELSEYECHRLLVDGPVAHLGVIDGDVAYVTPLSYVVSDNRLGFRTGPGRRLRAIEANPRVCIEVSRFNTATGVWSSVIAYGTASVVDGQQAAAPIVTGLLAKYRHSADPLAPSVGDDAVVVVVDIDAISGRRSGSFFSVPTRPGRL
jgi:nitroimidazol reductase NimA-like FMN-containing flavoprotein (pyridoxamine 5'-phosphate oxidase superfamily)